MFYFVDENLNIKLNIKKNSIKMDSEEIIQVILETINHIRKNQHQRVTEESINKYLKIKSQKEYGSLTLEKTKSILKNMMELNIIGTSAKKCDRGKKKTSCVILSEKVSGFELINIKTMMELESSIITHNENNKTENINSSINSSKLDEEFIDTKFKEALIKSITENITMQIEASLTEILSKDNSNIKLIQHLEGEILYLRKQLEEKNALLLSIIKDCKIRNVITLECKEHKDEKRSLNANDLTTSQRNSNIKQNDETTKLTNRFSGLSNDAEEIEFINDKQEKKVEKRKGKHRSTVIIGDSMLKGKGKDRSTVIIGDSMLKGKGKDRSTVIIGDSMLKGIGQHKIRNGLGTGEKVYVKSFPGATINDMKSYGIPSKAYNNDVVILHIGTNNLKDAKNAQEIATEIIDIAVEMKSDKNEVMISGIIPRNDKFNGKGIEVNNF